MPTRKAAPTAKGCVTSNGTVLTLKGATCDFAKNVYTEVMYANDRGVPGAYSPKAGRIFMFAQEGNASSDTVRCYGPGGGGEGFMAPGTSVSWSNRR